MFWLNRVGLINFCFKALIRVVFLTLHSTNLFFLYQLLPLDKEDLVRVLDFYFYGANTCCIFTFLYTVLTFLPLIPSAGRCISLSTSNLLWKT